MMMCLSFPPFVKATKEAIATLVEFYKSAERKATNHDKNAAVLVQTAEETWQTLRGWDKWKYLEREEWK